MASLKYMISELVDEREKMERAVWQEYLQNKHGGAPKHPATHNSIKQHKNNAIKYGGDEPWVKVVFYRENWDWVLTVTDRGIGMPERVLKRIFRQFYRVKDKKVKNKTGFGLGLAFAKKVVNAYGGEIRVESAPGKGSRFEVRIKAE